MKIYERIRYCGKTVILRNPTKMEMLGEEVLTGIEVNKYGEEIVPKGVDERRLIISLSFIRWRRILRWNNHYGELEERKNGEEIRE